MKLSAAAALLGWAWLASEACAIAKGITIDQLCPIGKSGSPKFSPTALMTAALDLNPPSRRTLDVNGDGTETPEERLSVVILNPCAQTGSACAADSSNIAEVRSTLLSMFSRGDELVITRRRGPPTPDEIRNEAWLDMKARRGDPGSVPELMDPKQRFLSVACRVPTKPAGKPPEIADGGAAPPEKPQLRVTSKFEELARPDGLKLKSVDVATLSVEKDTVGDKLTFGIDAIVGLSFAIGQQQDAVIPFVQYQRTSVRDTSVSPATTKRGPDKLGLGTVVSLHLAGYNDVDVAPIYIVDYEKHSRVVSVKANWIPSFLRQIDPIAVMRSRPLISGLLDYVVTPRVLFQASHVLGAGTNAELIDTSSFVRLGADLTLDLWGDGVLKKFTGSLGYKRLFRIGSGPEGVHLLKTSIQYWLDPDEHVSVGYTFEHGLDEDTTTKVNDWKVSVGVRF